LHSGWLHKLRKILFLRECSRFLTRSPKMKHANWRSSQEIRRRNMPSRLSLGQRKFMSALGTFSHVTLYRGRTARTSKGSAIRYVEREAAFRTINHTFRLRTQSRSLSSNQQLSENLKTFLRTLKRLDVEILTALKTIKYHDSKYMENCLSRRISLGTNVEIE
jgi:hypothetical protein